MFGEEELRLTLARPSFVSAQYLWNFTIFACSKCMRLSNTAFTFSWKWTSNEMKELTYLSLLYFNLILKLIKQKQHITDSLNLMEKIRHNHIFIGNIITGNQQSQGTTALLHELLYGGLTSSCLKFFLSEIMTSFQTTSTPSSVSMAKYASSIPGTLRWLTYSRKLFFRSHISQQKKKTYETKQQKLFFRRHCRIIFFINTCHKKLPF